MVSGKEIKMFSIVKPENSFISYGDWLGAPREQKYFTSERVVVRQIVGGKDGKIIAGYTKKEYYNTQVAFNIVPKEKSYSVLALSSLLNSHLYSFYHSYKYLDVNKKTFQKILIKNCKVFPWPDLTQKQIAKLEEFANELVVNFSNETFSQLNNYIYKLFKLTETQIELIESRFDSVEEEELKKLVA